MKQSVILIATTTFISTYAQSAVVINEVIGSTTGADTEFIELFNTGSTAIDISGWSIAEIESDPGMTFGVEDDTFSIPGVANDGTVSLPAGGFYLIGNENFITEFDITPDLELPLSIENSSYTLSLRDADGVAQYNALVSDGDGAIPSGLTADISVGPDGDFLPAGFALEVDGGDTARLLEFAPTPAPSATPGFSNVPEPGTFLLTTIAGMVGILRRQRQS